MKTIIIALMSMITTVFYAQSPEELESHNYLNNNLVLSTIPSLVGKDYFILSAIEGQIAVISKINNNYTYYNIKIGGLGETTIIDTIVVSYKPVLDKIFTNFVPKAGVKKYLSEYGNLLSDDRFGAFYMAIYKKGIRTFDTNVLSLRNTNRESPIDEDIVNFIYIYLIANPDKL